MGASSLLAAVVAVAALAHSAVASGNLNFQHCSMQQMPALPASYFYNLKEGLWTTVRLSRNADSVYSKYLQGEAYTFTKIGLTHGSRGVPAKFSVVRNVVKINNACTSEAVLCEHIKQTCVSSYVPNWNLNTARYEMSNHDFYLLATDYNTTAVMVHKISQHGHKLNGYTLIRVLVLKQEDGTLSAINPEVTGEALNFCAGPLSDINSEAGYMKLGLVDCPKVQQNTTPK